MSRELKIAASDLSVTFTPSGDRFAQRIEIGGEVLLAVDEDAESTDSWPPSPPLQEVHLEQRPDGRQLALMIGRAGSSHWSISCELQLASGELSFDIACRIKEPAVWLGSSYQLPPTVTFQGNRQSGVLLRESQVLCRWKAEDDCEILFDAGAGRLSFTPKPSPKGMPSVQHDLFPRTIRWRYRLLGVFNSVDRS